MRHIIHTFFAACLVVGLGCSFGLVAEDQNITEPCSKELLLSYFPAPFVENTLKKFTVPEKEWEGILTGLAEQDERVVPLVEERAEKMTPNPLQDPEKRQEAIHLFRQTLFELFSSVMQKHGVNNKEQIQKMLDDVQYQKANHFAVCMERYRKQREEEQEAEEMLPMDEMDQDEFIEEEDYTTP